MFMTKIMTEPTYTYFVLFKKIILLLIGHSFILYISDLKCTSIINIFEIIK